MSKYLKKIAQILSFKSEQEARNFCEAIQRRCESPVPSFERVLEHLGKNLTSISDPKFDVLELATSIEKSVPSQLNQNNYAMEKKPRKRSHRVPSTLSSLRHDIRKPADHFKKCPHGIAITGLCHLCKGGTVDY